jgi:AcrR family transcriptional regulator
MPRIEAKNIDEHIRLQTDRILSAASDLFRTHGYRGTDMGEIAKSIGLARNSLYRYYSSKDHVLVACMQKDMMPFIEVVDQLEESVADPVERIDAWLDIQMDMATGPCHTMINLLGDVREVSPELRKEIGVLHESPRRVLEGAVEEILNGRGRNVSLLTGMIAGMVQSAGSQIINSGDKAAVLTELKQSVRKVLED